MKEPILPNDPLLCDFDLPLRATFYPLGFPVQIETNSEQVLYAAENSWNSFHQEFYVAPVELRFAVDTEGPSDVPPEPVPRCRGNLLTFVADRSNFLVCDVKRGLGFSWLSPGMAASHPHLRYHFLEAAALILLESIHLTAIHAACLALDGRGILLCGDSEAGKSSLAFACARRGWTFISDDASSLVRDNTERQVRGNPHRMRFREDARRLFPELRVHASHPRLNGKMAIELDTKTLPWIRTAPSAYVEHIVFLNRQPLASPSVVSFPRERALRWLEQVICFGDHELRDAQRASLRRLLAAEIVQLTYSDLDSAVSALESMVEERSRHSSSLAVSAD